MKKKQRKINKSIETTTVASILDSSPSFEGNYNGFKESPYEAYDRILEEGLDALIQWNSAMEEAEKLFTPKIKRLQDVGINVLKKHLPKDIMGDKIALKEILGPDINWVALHFPSFHGMRDNGILINEDGRSPYLVERSYLHLGVKDFAVIVRNQCKAYKKKREEIDKATAEWRIKELRKSMSKDLMEIERLSKLIGK